MPTREAVVTAARAYRGTPYHHQAALRGAGCDCLGLVRGVWRDLYGHEPEVAPPYTPDWGEVGRQEVMLEAARRHLTPVPIGTMQAGDVVVFRLRDGMIAKHAAIVTGPNRMIHAQSNARVCEVTMNGWWQRRVAGAFAFPGVT